MQQVFRASFGRVLSAVVGAIGLVAFVVMAIDDPGTALRAAPWLALLTGTCWAVFWRPAVVVDDAGVHIVNVLRTIDLPWPAIVGIDTTWALTLDTAYGSFTAWAAPAGGAFAVRRATPRDVHHHPGTTSSDGAVRPGDLLTSASGGAALAIRRHRERLADAGYLDDPRLEHESAPITWHVATIAGGVVLLALALVALVV